MTYSEEEIQNYLNILHSFNDTYNNTVFQDTIPLKTPKKCLVIIAVIYFIKDDGLRYCDKCFHSNGQW